MRVIRLLVPALLAAAPVAAQHGHEGMGRPGHGPGTMSHMMHGMMSPMMGGMAYSPAHLLRHRETLDLTVQQVTRLTALHDAATTAHDEAAKRARTHHAQLKQALDAERPDTAAARRHFQAAHAAMGEAHWAQLRASVQARAVLTAVQRARVEGWADAMRMGHGGKPHGHSRDDDDS